MSQQKEIDETFNRAASVLRQKNDESAAILLEALYTKAVIEIMNCLDPRHGVTAAEARDAVFDASPYREALTWAKELDR